MRGRRVLAPHSGVAVRNGAGSMATLVNRSVTGADSETISALHARVFGPGRFVRTAYRVREGLPNHSPYCLLALLDDVVVASVRFTPIAIGGRVGALMLGPLAVETEHAGKGFGKQLVADGLASARQAGQKLVVLVGNETYYARFGFAPVPVGQMNMPGPVDLRRLLAAELVPNALSEYRGAIVADRTQ